MIFESDTEPTDMDTNIRCSISNEGLNVSKTNNSNQVSAQKKCSVQKKKLNKKKFILFLLAYNIRISSSSFNDSKIVKNLKTKILNSKKIESKEDSDIFLTKNDFTVY